MEQTFNLREKQSIFAMINHIPSNSGTGIILFRKFHHRSALTNFKMLNTFITVNRFWRLAFVEYVNKWNSSGELESGTVHSFQKLWCSVTHKLDVLSIAHFCDKIMTYRSDVFLMFLLLISFCRIKVEQIKGGQNTAEIHFSTNFLLSWLEASKTFHPSFLCYKGSSIRIV